MKKLKFLWLREPQVQDLLGLKRTTLYYMRKKNLIRWSLVGRTVFYDRASIEQFIDANASQFNSPKNLVENEH